MCRSAQEKHEKWQQRRCETSIEGATSTATPQKDTTTVTLTCLPWNPRLLFVQWATTSHPQKQDNEHNSRKECSTNPADRTSNTRMNPWRPGFPDRLTKNERAGGGMQRPAVIDNSEEPR